MRSAALARAASVALFIASVCSSQVDERCPSTAIDHSPKLLSSLNPLKETARNEGYKGRLLFRVTVTETGSSRAPLVKYPAQLAESDKVKSEIVKLRFCPAVRYSQYTECQIEFDIELK